MAMLDVDKAGTFDVTRDEQNERGVLADARRSRAPSKGGCRIPWCWQVDFGGELGVDWELDLILCHMQFFCKKNECVRNRMSPLDQMEVL